MKYSSGSTTLLVVVNFTEFAHTTLYYTSDFLSKKYLNLLRSVRQAQARRKSHHYIPLEGNSVGKLSQIPRFLHLKVCANTADLRKKIWDFLLNIIILHYITVKHFRLKCRLRISFGMKSCKCFLSLPFFGPSSLPLLKCHICNFIRERFNELLSEF